jgi:uncharacterized cofD-like protein
VSEVAIEPPDPPALPEVMGAIERADLVVLGPGSLFTSTIPPVLVPGARAALQRTSATVVYVCNIMTEAGETDGFDAYRHVEALRRHLGRAPDVVMLNSAPVDAARIAAYRAEGAETVAESLDRLRTEGSEILRLPLLGGGPHAQHDSQKLAGWLEDLARRRAASRRTGWPA